MGGNQNISHTFKVFKKYWSQAIQPFWKKKLPTFYTYFFFLQILTGVGFAICVSCMFQSIVDMSVITWSAQAFYLLFTGQVFTENFFYGQVLDWEDGSGLDNLGTLHGQLSLCLGIACLVIFILIAAGTRSVGKVIFYPDFDQKRKGTLILKTIFICDSMV